MQRTTSTTMLFLFALVALAAAADPDAGQPQMIQESPSDQQARIGEQVLLKCKFKNLKGEPQWCIDDFCLGVSKKDAGSASGAGGGESLVLKGRPRHRIIGNKTRGEFHLLIEPIQLQDNMYYYCMATAASEHVKAVKSKKAFVTVLTFPQTLHLDSPIHVSLNKPSTIQCTARQSRPPVKILIAINGQLITDERKYKTEILRIPIDSANDESRGQLSYISPSTHIPVDQLRTSFYDTITNITLDDITMKMQGQVVECFAYSFMNSNHNQKLAHHKSGIHSGLSLNAFQSNVMNTKSVIQVDYAPEVNLKILSSNRILKEEDVISLVCETRATPPIHSYKWFIGKNYLQGVTDFNLNLKLRREMHLQTVTCEASNTVASVKAALQLNIFFKPSFQKGPRSYLLVDKNACNKPLTLDCQVNANPGANVTWYRRRPSRRAAVQSNKYLSLFNFDTTKFKINLSDNEGGAGNDAFEDEWIGEGPTYTIASLNCANFLSNVRNVTSQRHLPPSPVKPTTPGSRQQAKRPQRDTSGADAAPEYEDDVDFGGFDELAGPQGFQFEADKQAADNNDFGVYICVAKNRVVDGSGHHSGTAEQHQTSKRFIKLNPVGAPIVRALPTSLAQLDETEAKAAAEAETIEVSATVGSSATLTCIIEPVPEFSTVYWVKEGGKVIPNSRYSTTDEFGSNEKNAVYSISSGEKSASDPKHRAAVANFKVKYENVTSASDKTAKAALSASPVDGVVAYDSVGIMRSVLFIRHVRKQDLGVYKCKAINAYGSRVASIVLREKTLLDTFSNNSFFSFALIVVVVSFVFLAIVLFVACALSKRIRLLLCCCCRCCLGYEKAKEKGLSRNLNIELHSDKTINDWLASSKLSNDTGNGSLINATETTNNTTTTILLNNSLDKLQCGSNNSNFKGHYESAVKALLPMKHQQHDDLFNEANTDNSNCKDELGPSDNEDEDQDEEEEEENDYDDHNMHYEDDLDEKHELELASFSKSGKRSASKFDKDEFKMDGLNQFSRYLASSALLNPQKEYDYNKMNTSDDESGKKLTITINPAVASTKTIMVPPMMMIRSQNFTNGNFNAKISASGLLPNGTGASNTSMNGDGQKQNYPTDSLRKQAPKLQFQELNRQVDKHQFYESNPIHMNGGKGLNGFSRPEEAIDDLAQMLQDSTFRLSDIFSELSPSQTTFSQARAHNTFSNNKPSFNGVYQQPNGLSSNSGTLTKSNKAPVDHYINPVIDTSGKASSTLLRQYQLGTTSRIQSPQSQASSSPNTQVFTSDQDSNYSDNTVNNTLNGRLLNKFPHPHPFLTSTAGSVNSSSSFTSNENPSKTSTFVEACFPPEKNSSVTSGAYPIAKIITTSSINGSNKYQTVV